MGATDVGSKKNFRAVIGRLNPFRKVEKLKDDATTDRDRKKLKERGNSSSGIPTMSVNDVVNYRKKRIKRKKMVRKSKQRNR